MDSRGEPLCRASWVARPVPSPAMSSASLQILPTRTGGAAENMALDFLLLSRCPGPAAPRFRHYEWRGPAFTFGFSQKLDWVRENLPTDETFDLCRRPTGGGIVDHRHDWTYALVLPRGHVLADERASESYRLVHESLAAALVALGQPAVLKETGGGRPEAGDGESLAEAGPPGAAVTAKPGRGVPEPGFPGICFQKAERFDVVHAVTGAKIAGAAQKRSKQGMLFQGSIEKNAVGSVDWEVFQERFSAELARVLGVQPQEAPWPELADHEVEGLTEQYSSPEWLAYR